MAIFVAFKPQDCALLRVVCLAFFFIVEFSAGLERDFSIASLVLPPRRNRLLAKYLKAQLICEVNIKAMPSLDKISSKMPGKKTQRV